jgi:hypothetical protein
MEHTHLLCPYKKFQPHGIHMCGENKLLVRRLLNWTSGRTVDTTDIVDIVDIVHFSLSL